MVTRKVWWCSNDHWCENEVFVNIKTTWYFQPQALILCLTVTHNKDLASINAHKYFQKYIGWHLSVDCPMTSATDKMNFLALESYNMVFWHWFFDNIKCKMHPGFRNYKIHNQVPLVYEKIQYTAPAVIPLICIKTANSSITLKSMSIP